MVNFLPKTAVFWVKNYKIFAFIMAKMLWKSNRRPLGIFNREMRMFFLF
jgi:hypothetical protein